MYALPASQAHTGAGSSPRSSSIWDIPGMVRDLAFRLRIGPRQPNAAGWSRDHVMGGAGRAALAGSFAVSSARDDGNRGKFTLNDVRRHTCSNPDGDTCIADLFRAYRHETGRIFGADISASCRLKDMETNLADNPLPALGRPLETGSVRFRNYFANGIVIRRSNFKDPELADFFLSDVLWIQQEKAGVAHPLKCMVIQDIISRASKAFFEKHAFTDRATMSNAQLREFLCEANKPTLHILRCWKVEPISAQVLKQGPAPSVVLKLKGMH